MAPTKIVGYCDLTWLNELVVGLPNNSYKPIINMTWVRAQLCKLQNSTRNRK